MSLFDTVYRNMERLHAEGKMSHHPSQYVGRIRPQIRDTSIGELSPLQPYKVKALMTFNHPTVHNKDGSVSKRQPAPFKPGDILWAKREVNGWIRLYPFELAGTGWEMVKDAIEGKHYEFV